jgi:F0F1-type ATP synthase assembly protein I
MKFAVVLQLCVAVVVVLISWLGFGSEAGKSALIASVVAIVPNALFALYLLLAPKPAEYRFFVGEGIKIVVALIAATMVWWKYGVYVQPLAYWLALIVVLKAHNFGLLRTEMK